MLIGIKSIGLLEIAGQIFEQNSSQSPKIYERTLFSKIIRRWGDFYQEKMGRNFFEDNQNQGTNSQILPGTLTGFWEFLVENKSSPSFSFWKKNS